MTKTYRENKRTYCECIGIDNKIYRIRSDALQSGATKHIQHAERKNVAKDITNMRFGNLVALYPTNKRASNGSIIWHCICDCGNEVDVQIGNLMREHTLSCGCRKDSKWEIYISDYLKSRKIVFEPQKRFVDCKNKKGSDMLPFDFYIPSINMIIEYDGEHHFSPIKGWGGEEKFKLTRENDNIKNNYCMENGIKLLRIPYTETKEGIINILNAYLSPATITVA